jgi:hypothetical protein
MAIKIGNKSEEGVYKLYKGIAALNVVAVNPNKAQLEKITGRTVDEEPVYLGKDEEGNDTVRVTIYAKTAPGAKVNNDIDLNVNFSFILTRATRVGQASGKTQIIDKYGRTAWATPTDLSNKTIPVYSSGPANIAPDYRPAARGEEFLVNFLIKWLNIPAPANYKDGKWIMKDNPEDSEVSLNLNKLFAGDVSEISSLVEPAAEFAVKAAVGIRTTDDGKQYQAVFTREFAKNSVTDYSKLDAAITEFKNAGGAPNTEYDCSPLHENVVESTKFVAPNTEVAGDMPDFANVQNPWA